MGTTKDTYERVKGEIKETKEEAMRKALKIAKKWFEDFGYNAYGIALSDDVDDHTEVLEEIKYALGKE